MRHIELHIISTAEDVEFAELSGLVELTDNEVCESCGNEVGFDHYGDFVPLCVVLDDINEWIVCLECADPVVIPSLYEAADDEEDYTEN